jgi:RNA recognition motif-containing protein
VPKPDAGEPTTKAVEDGAYIFFSVNSRSQDKTRIREDLSRYSSVLDIGVHNGVGYVGFGNADEAQNAVASLGYDFITHQAW